MLILSIFSMGCVSPTEPERVSPPIIPIPTPEIIYVYITPVPTTIPTPILIVKPTDNTEEAHKFVTHVQKYWVYVDDAPGQVVRHPTESFKLMYGDCDDFATMVAYYLEEVYGYDTELVILEMQDGGLHLAAFVASTDEYIQYKIRYCGNVGISTYTKDDGQIFAPIDMVPCPNWKWATLGKGVISFEWEDFIGLIV